MAPELSANWRRLQAQIKAESSQGPAKRKASSASLELGVVKRRKFSGTREHRKVQPRMGQTQSSKPADTTDLASLALWEEDVDGKDEQAASQRQRASHRHEAMAHAYGLGTRNGSLLENATHPNQGLTPGLEVGKYLAIDCEMVGVGEGGRQSVLARVSIVDFHGQQVYDSYVRPKERVTDWRTWVSGVSARNMAAARSLDEVQKDVSELLKRDRILVGHDVKHDLDALLLVHPKHQIRDTAKFSGFKKYGHGPKPALRVLARDLLGVEIQTGAHSSIEDARVAMLLFRRNKQAFDVEAANQYQKTQVQRAKPANGQKKKKKKKQKGKD
jgi:RNA exonuclease 4